MGEDALSAALRTVYARVTFPYARSYQTATETTSVLFCVRASSDVSAQDLDRIRSMSVEWPGGSSWTPVASGSRITSGERTVCTWQPAVLLVGRGAFYRLVAAAGVQQVELAVGTYILHVTFGPFNSRYVTIPFTVP